MLKYNNLMTEDHRIKAEHWVTHVTVTQVVRVQNVHVFQLDHKYV